ncbi:unnamed protein product [Paramecium octaurelia]|uniref:Tetratricopeptide repeat protein n=1 Tax=Paramecium octaurelia TaxID=43137 RepID=A0A8S1VVE9_PAROT|nr:unnamed protein product [Paramecium octaurelia]
MLQQCECKIEGNMKVQIIGICLNQDCSEEWFCQNCVKNHDGHEKDLQSGDQMDQLLQQYNSAENQKFLEADEKFQKLQEYYNSVLQENQNDIKMLDNLQKFIEEENFEGINKYLDQFKKYKQQIDNNKPAQIFKELDSRLNDLKKLDFSDLFEDEANRKRKAKVKEDLTQAKQFFDAQNFNEALQILEHSLEIDKEFIEPLLLKIQTLIQLEIFENAINYCNQLIQTKKQNFEVLFLNSIVLLFISKYDESEKELYNAYRNSPYRFYWLILNLIEELEETCTVAKDFIKLQNFDLKQQLQSLIKYNEIPPQILKQQISIIIQFIKLVDKKDLQKALFQFNQNFQVIDDYRKQHDVDIRPNIDPKKWQEVLNYLETKFKTQDIVQQHSDQFQVQFNNFISDTPDQLQAQKQIQHNQMNSETKRDFAKFINDTIQPQDSPNSDQQSKQNNGSQTQLLQDKPNAKLQQESKPQNQGINKIQENLCTEQSNIKVERKGVKLDENNRLNEVLKYTDKQILQNQNVSQYYYKKATILSKLNLPEIALQFIDQAINLDNKEANYQYRKALLLISLGQFQQALQQFDIAIEINPKSACYYYEKGKALQILGRQNEAEKQFQLARQMEQNDYR